MATKTAIIARVALNLVGITGLKTVYSAGATSGPSGKVLELPDEIAPSLPAAVLLSNEGPIIPGPWERQTWTLHGTIWAPSRPRGESYRRLVDIGDLVVLALQQPDVTAVDQAVQSVVLTGFDAIQGMQWNRGADAPWYLVLPFTIEAKVNRPATYGPA